MRTWLFLLLAGCTGSGTSSSSDAVTQATTQATATHDQAKSCFDDFQTCIDSASDDTAVKACQDALTACLPQASGIGAPNAPDLCSDAPPAGACDGGMNHQGPPPPNGGMQPPPNGGMQPPPNGGSTGGIPNGTPPSPPPDGKGPPPPFPVSPATHIALATCHAELKKCLDASGTDCVKTDHQCVHAALTADFTQLCASLGDLCASCPDSQRCSDLSAKCAAGLTLPDSP